MDTKTQMIVTAARLFQRNGYHATSWRTLVDAAGTPWGSAHHHFPGGKEQLAVAAIERAGEATAAAIERIFEASDGPSDAVRAWCRANAAQLEASGYRDGCPIATVALESTPASAALTAATRAVFERWLALVAARLERAGIGRKRAEELATLALTNLEGALLLGRVSGSTAPLLLVGEQLGTWLDAELGSVKPKRSKARKKK